MTDWADKRRSRLESRQRLLDRHIQHQLELVKLPCLTAIPVEWLKLVLRRPQSLLRRGWRVVVPAGPERFRAYAIGNPPGGLGQVFCVSRDLRQVLLASFGSSLVQMTWLRTRDGQIEANSFRPRVARHSQSGLNQDELAQWLAAQDRVVAL